MRYRLISAFGAPLLWGCAFLLSGCPEKSQTLIDSTEDSVDADFDWNVPEGQALPNVPEDNPMSEAKFQLGRHLFYDTRLSGNQTFSCASCHHQDKAFSDGLAQSLGSTGQIHPRNAQALVNVGYNSSVNWGNPVTITLENQAPIPIFGEDPVEMGVNGDNQDEVLQRFRDSELYQRLFAEAFPDETDQIDFDHIVKALSTFGRGLNSFNSPYDRYVAGEGSALSDSAVRGMEMFFSETHECFHCHGTEHFSSSSTDRTQLFSNRQFHNNGLYNLGGTGDYPEGGQGVFEVSGNAADKGAFRPPTLRNIELTAPYMHDGTIATLEDVIRHYAAGGRNITSGPNAGDGRLNPNKSSMVPGFTVTEQNVEDLVAFLESLTDHDFVTPPFFQPFFRRIMFMRYVLLMICLFTWPLTLLAHGKKPHEGEAKFEIWSAASVSWYSQGAVDNNEYWRIPGVMMGGDALPVKEGFALDDAILGSHYRLTEKTKVTAKLAVHADDSNHSQLNLENLFFSYQFNKQLGVSLGQMEANFSPTASYHASLQNMAEAPLVADAFWGRSFHDVGVQVAWQPIPSLTLGLEAWDGQSFPATSGKDGGSQDVYLKWSQPWKNWQFQAGLWGMRAEAFQRGDDRYSSGHSHGSDFSPLPDDIRFSGDTMMNGVWLSLMTPVWSQWQFQLSAEMVKCLLNSQSDGNLIDTTRQADYETDHSGYYVMPTLVWGDHQLSYRYEQLLLKNTLKGAAAQILAEQANLINEQDPVRQTVQWRWQISEDFAWRMAYTQDESLPEMTERYSVGLVFNRSLFSMH